MTRSVADESPDGRGNDRAVSPVIAVILMVAITVILAAVVGVFGLGFGGETQAEPPQIAWDHEVYFDDSTDELTRLEIVHENGGALNMEYVTVLIDGDEADSASGLNYDAPSDELRSPDSLTFNFTAGSPYEAGDEIRIVWSPPDSTETQVIETYELGRDTV